MLPSSVGPGSHLFQNQGEDSVSETQTSQAGQQMGLLCDGMCRAKFEPRCAPGKNDAMDLPLEWGHGIRPHINCRGADAGRGTRFPSRPSPPRLWHTERDDF